MFRDTYNSYNENISPRDKLIADTIDKINAENITNANKVIGFKKPFAVAAVIIVIVIAMFSLPVVAVQIDPLYNIMYHFSPGFAQFYIPIIESSISNDVKMDVLACYVHEDTIEIYLTMQDLTGERFAGSVDLYDSYSINTPCDSSANCRQISYDDKTKTAGFLITVSQWNDEDIVGDKITFTVKEIISDFKEYSLNVPMDLSSVTSAPKTQEVYINGGSMLEYKDCTDVLVPNTPYEEFKVEGVDLTGIGYIDGKLHIQYGVKDVLKYDNHGSFYLVDTINDKVKPIYSEDDIYFWDRDNNIRYHESVFDISPKVLENYKLFCQFYTTGENIKGNWKVTFQVENKGEYIPSEEDVMYVARDIGLSDIETMNIGAELPKLLYADEDKVIINGTCGIVVYDLNEKCIANRLSADELKQRGIFNALAFSSMNGRYVYIYDFEESSHSALDELMLYKYNLFYNSLSQRKGLVEDVYPKQEFGFSAEDREYMDNSKLTGSLSVNRDNDFIFLQADTDWSMSSLQIVICDYDTGEKEIIDVFE